MGKYKIVVSNSSSLAGVEKMKTLCDVKIKGKDTSDELWRTWLSEADAVYSTGTMKVNQQLLDIAPKVKVVSQVAVGYDNIDVAACTKRGIKVGNTPGVVAEATADMAYGLILCSARYLHLAWQHVKSGEWGRKKPFLMGTDLKNKLLGIIGLGSVGLAVAKRARASGMSIAYHNRKPSVDAFCVDACYMEMEELLARADFVLLSIPLTSATKKMFGDAQFDRMKPTARFINVGRGALVDTDALYRALSEEKIAYAALDVTDPEPLPGDHPLLSLDNIVVFPHIGGQTRETRDAMSLMALENLLAGLEGRAMPSCVNVSELKG